jgi:nucleotidyltransferase/DNA polymerase involved in DNA repair
MSYIDKRAWPDDPKLCLSQIVGVGDKLSIELIKNGVRSIEALSNLTPAALSETI